MPNAQPPRPAGGKVDQGPQVPSSKSLVGMKDPHRKKILVMGLRRSGKTSCQEVVFHGMGPKDTFYIEPTFRVSKENFNTLIPLQLWDCPGSMMVENLDALLSAFSTLVYVIDIQDEYTHAIAQLVYLLAIVYEVHPTINIEVFVHKAESMSDDYKIENFRLIQERVYDETLDHPLPLENLQLTFYLTSVYDHTIYEAWSRVIQKLIPPLATLENLMNVLCSNSGLTKAFLFDIKTLIHVAADESPPDAMTYGLCCEYVQTLHQFSTLYENVKHESNDEPESSLPPPESNGSKTSFRPSLTSSSAHHSSNSVTNKTSSNNSSTTRPLLNTSLSAVPASISSPLASSTRSSTTASQVSIELDPEDDQVWSSSCVRLKPQTTLAYWQITNQLSLVALIRSETYEASQSLIDYNVTFFRKAVHRIVELERAKWPPDD